MADSIEKYYMVWGSDEAAYGPVDVATLEGWAKDGRLTPDMWVFAGESEVWQRARKVAELRPIFGVTGDTTRLALPPRINLRELRGVRVLDVLSDEELSVFARLVEIRQVPASGRVISEGERGDSLYFILKGELGVSLQVSGQEVHLTTLQAGDFFGDMALLNRSTRAASVTARTACVLAELTASALDGITRREPQAGAHFLKAVDLALTERIRADNDRLAQVVTAARLTP
jgi:CRP-like cAMP-binding protein